MPPTEGTLTNPAEVVKDLESKIEKIIGDVNADKASKADVAALDKAIKTLKATVEAMQGEGEGDKAIEKYANGRVIWTKAMSRKANAIWGKSLEQDNIWRKADNPEAIRKHYLDKGLMNEGGMYRDYLTKATNVNEIDSTSALGMLRTDVDSLIHQLVPIYGVARRETRVIAGVRGFLNINSLTGYPNFARTVTSTVNRDDSTVTPNSPTYTKITVQPLQSSGIIKVTEKAIFDAVPGVLENATEALAIQAGYAEDVELFTGDGTATYGMFTGLKTATIGYNNGVSTARNGSFTNFDPLLMMQANVYPSIMKSGRCKYYMHPFTFAVLQTFKASTSGVYFYDIATSQWKISGTPIEFSQVIDTPTTAGGTTYSVGSVPVYFGDLERAVTMVIGRDMQLKILDQLYAATNEIGARLTYDFAFGIVLSAAMTRLSITS